MPPKRYYIHHEEIDSSWQVFDRQNPKPQDDNIMIAVCRNKHYADKICTALNAMDA